MFRLLRFLPSRWWRPSAWKTWASYIHWRLETYGTYDAGGRMNWNSFRMLLRQFPSYLRWLKEIDHRRGLAPIPHF